jgi:hypothetical protein
VSIEEFVAMLDFLYVHIKVYAGWSLILNLDLKDPEIVSRTTDNNIRNPRYEWYFGCLEAHQLFSTLDEGYMVWFLKLLVHD